MVLRRDHFIAVSDQQLDDLAEAGSVGPQTMCEDNAGFAGHAAPPLFISGDRNPAFTRPQNGRRSSTKIDNVQDVGWVLVRAVTSKPSHPPPHCDARVTVRVLPAREPPWRPAGRRIPPPRRSSASTFP